MVQELLKWCTISYIARWKVNYAILMTAQGASVLAWTPRHLLTVAIKTLDGSKEGVTGWNFMTLALKVRIRESGRSAPNLNIYEDRKQFLHFMYFYVYLLKRGDRVQKDKDISILSVEQISHSYGLIISFKLA